MVSIAVCTSIGFLSSLATYNSIDTWYTTIKKPFFHPPSWSLQLIWMALYIVIGYAFAIVWSKRAQSRRSKSVIKNAMILFGLQLVLNALWSFLFFGLCNPFLALIEIFLLLLLIYETIKAFEKIDSYAAKLLKPYIIWVSFAAFLNGTIWFMNC